MGRECECGKSKDYSISVCDCGESEPLRRLASPHPHRSQYRSGPNILVFYCDCCLFCRGYLASQRNSLGFCIGTIRSCPNHKKQSQTKLLKITLTGLSTYFCVVSLIHKKTCATLLSCLPFPWPAARCQPVCLPDFMCTNVSPRPSVSAVLFWLSSFWSAVSKHMDSWTRFAPHPSRRKQSAPNVPTC